MFTMGSDFNYEAAETWYENLDKIIKAVNADGRVHAFYSTPAEYVAAKQKETDVTWPLFDGNNADFFPYADGEHQFWTGYFTSRPALKRYVRSSSSFFSALRQIQAIGNTNPDPLGQIQKLEEALGVAQHHDAVSGTAKQHVTFDYAQRISVGRDQAAAVLSSSLASIVGASAATGFAQCARLNESVCEHAVAGVPLLFWNPTSQPRTETVTIPLPHGSAGVSVRELSGVLIRSDLIPSAESVSNYARNTNESELTAVFQVSVPPLGSAVYSLSAAGTAAGVKAEVRAEDFVVENEFVSLLFSGATGRLASWTNKKTSTRIAVDQSFCWYESSKGNDDGSPGSGQPSGAYIFRPNSSTCTPVVPDDGSIPQISVINGTLVTEVRQVFSNWLTQTIRLAAGDRFATFEFTVGPIPLVDPNATKDQDSCVAWRQTGNCDPNGPREPAADKPCTAVIDGPQSGYCECGNGRKAAESHCGHIGLTCADACIIKIGKEVVSRFTTSIVSQGQLLTDSNGREMLLRKRDSRPAWKLNQTEEVKPGSVKSLICF
jgi:hypothetical protein